jgi:ankyrin repeat protein
MSKLSGKDPQPLLNDIYESIWASNRAITNRQNFNGKTGSLLSKCFFFFAFFFDAKSLFGSAVLHYVSGLGYSDTVKHTIKRLVMNDLNLLDVNMRTPLFYAVEAAHEDIVKDLLEAGATFHNKDIITETVSDLALRMGHFEILRMLNEAREKQEAANKAKGKRAGAAGPFSAKKVAAVSIHAAARADNVAALERAIADAKQESAKASILSPSQATPTSPALRAGMPAVGVDAVNEEGATGLHIAAASGNMKSLRVLLAAGANINAVDDAGATPLHQAVAAQKTECVEVLVDSGANLEAIDDTKSTPLNLAVSCNFEQIAKLLLAKGASINTVNERGFTPLHHACAFGYVEIARFLISKGADITAIAASDSSTPLHQAVFNGQHELITVLLEAGADLNQGDSKALHLACFNGHAMCVEILLANGANAGSVDAELSTPMHKAAYNGHSDCLKLLHAAGASVTAKDVEGATPLHKAAFSGKTDCVEFLLDSGASIDAIDSFEGTSLHNAAFQGHPETCALLLARGANILKVDDHKATVLHLAAISGRIETIKLLVEKGCPIDAIDDEGLSALMHAVRSIEAVSLLLKKGANVNFQDIKGRSALYLALLKHHDQSAKLLIEAGADPHQKDAKGVEPISLVSVEFKEIIMDAIKERQSLDDSSKLPKYEEAIKKFNNGGAKPTMEYLLNERLVENTPEDIARFFFKEAEALDGALLGEFLCHKNNADVLKAFCSRLNFEAQDLDQALRAYLQKFRLPGEAQQIDRCMEAFARRFFEQNPDIFPDSDTAYVLAFSLIMLNTDAHNPAILPEKKMTKEQFIRNNRGMWGPTHEDPPQELVRIE